MAGNQTLTIVYEMLNEVVARAVTAVSQADGGDGVGRHPSAGRPVPAAARRSHRGRRCRGAEEHWRTHMAVVGKVMLGQQAQTVVDLMDHL